VWFDSEKQIWKSDEAGFTGESRVSMSVFGVISFFIFCYFPPTVSLIFREFFIICRLFSL
jgi:hypothetical protein